ncbi:helix-turn-helix transcriptional regulator [Pseudonocardia hydrocarbonoxydans]|uniref:helix-turn-helix transcriptional regulator n=2 Tax=Pseudonocardia hydrocarbonoxydans TaxID=76726 RepID=UPI0031D9DA54
MTAPSIDDTGDAALAEQAWARGDAVAAIEAADRVLAEGSDPGARAAGVAAAAAAADGALLDAAGRWRGIAGVLDAEEHPAAAVWATARAALLCALAGDVDGGASDLSGARDHLPEPAPRGLTVLVDGAEATLDALQGDVEPAARRLAGHAATTVPADPLAPEQWGELAAAVAAAGGHDRAARAMLDPAPGSRPTTRQRLLAAGLDLRAGRHAEARAALAAVGGTAVLRRNAVLAATVGVGLARRSGDPAALAATWHRVVPVMAGADLELFLVDAWGELSVGAALVADDSADLPGAIAAAVTGAGSPWWAVASQLWWSLERAVVAEDAAAALAAAGPLTALAVDHPVLRVRAEAAAAWAQVLGGRVVADIVGGVAVALDAAGRPWEAAQLCRTATARAQDPAVARALLETGRRLRPARGPRRAAGSDELSDREREVGALVVDGLTHKEIGKRLYISPKTVEQHVARLRQKLSAATRADLVAALRARLG